MDWVHETHRHLYTRVDGKWARHPASARGLAALLLIYADEDGCIYLGANESPADAIARVVQAHASERKRILADVTALLEARADDPAYLVHEADRFRVRIRNFAAAQGIVPQSAEERSAERSKEAERAAAYRKRKKDGRDRDERRDGERDALAGGRAAAGTPAKVPSVPSVPTTATTTRAREVWDGLRDRLGRLGAVDLEDLGDWCRELGDSVDLPPGASVTPYVRLAMTKLADVVTAQPGTPLKDRLTFVQRTTIGLVNQDKPNGWASGKTNGAAGVCAPPSGPVKSGTRTAGPVAPTVPSNDDPDEKARMRRAAAGAGS